MGLDTVKMNRFTLAFDDAGLEREFLDEYADSVRMQVRVLWGLVVVCSLAVLPLDVRAHVPMLARVVRYGIMLPVTLLGLGITFASAKTFRRAYVPATVMAVCGLLANAPLQVAAVMFAARGELELSVTPAYALGAQMVTILGTLTVSTLRLRTVILPALAGAIGYVLVANAYPLPGIVAAAIALASIVLLVGIAATYQIESSRRLVFLQARRLAEQNERLGQERAKSESLLRNILPAEIVERLKSDPSHIADGFSEVTILFADIVGFTDLSARLSPVEVVAMLNRLFTAFDDLAERHGLEKIKTIGDAYMVVGGLPEPRPDHAEAVIAMALGMRDAVAAVAKETGYGLNVRIGANTGPVIAGVIGKKKFAYDLWGDAVNTASRMESHGVAGEIQVTEATWAKVKDRFELESRGPMSVKGKGEMPAWFVRGVKAA